MVDRRSTDSTCITPGYVGALTIAIAVLSLVFLAVVFGMGYWWQDPNLHGDAYFIDRMTRLWRTLPLIWLVLLVAAVFVRAICRNAPFTWIASFALVTSVLGVICLPMQVAHIYPNREKARMAGCLSNVKQLSLGLMMYAEDYDGHLPPMSSWNKASYEYVKNRNVYVCPSARISSLLPSYSMNRELAKVPIPNADKVVMIYESVSGRDLAGGPELLPSPSRHFGMVCIGFADGHAKACSEEDAKRLDWKP